MNVGSFSEAAVNTENLGFVLSENLFHWTINSTSLLIDWANPTTLRIFNNETIFPTEYNGECPASNRLPSLGCLKSCLFSDYFATRKNDCLLTSYFVAVQPVEITEADPLWAVYIIQDTAGFGSHPIHLHGHDFWVIAQDVGMFDIATTPTNLVNPPRRDVATLPSNGYLAIAFKKDNPGSWLLHCHVRYRRFICLPSSSGLLLKNFTVFLEFRVRQILTLSVTQIAWHASQGLAMQFVESQAEIAVAMEDAAIFRETCATWDTYDATAPHPQDDSGI